MTYLRVFTFFGLLACIGIIGCTSPAPTGGVGKPLPLAIQWRDPGFANPANPFDSIGFQHNQGLEYAYSHLTNLIGVGESDPLNPNSDTVAIHYCDSIYGYPADSLSAHLHYFRFVMSHVDSFFSVCPFDSLTVSYLNQIDSTLVNNDSLNSQITNIVNIENLAQVNLTGYEQEVVLIAGAISRYSDAYWRSSDSTKWIRPTIPGGPRPVVYYSAAPKRNNMRPLWGMWGGFIYATSNTDISDECGGLGGMIAGIGGGGLGIGFGALGGAVGCSLYMAMTGG